MAREVGCRNLLFMPFLQVFVEARPALFDSLFRLTAVEQVDTRRHSGVAVGIRVDDISGYVTRAREYRFQELSRNIPFANLLGIHDEKTVGASRKAALDCEEIAERRLVRILKIGACWKLCPFS